jgi:hypothetical protein
MISPANETSIYGWDFPVHYVSHNAHDYHLQTGIDRHDLLAKPAD